MIERLEKHPALHIYHFGAYEPSALKRLCARYATRGEQLDRLLRGGRFVDLHAVVREAFRIGVERYGLKELEPLHGFARKLDLRDAALARRDLELAIELGDDERITPELRAGRRLQRRGLPLDRSAAEMAGAQARRGHRGRPGNRATRRGGRRADRSCERARPAHRLASGRA